MLSGWDKLEHRRAAVIRGCPFTSNVVAECSKRRHTDRSAAAGPQSAVFCAGARTVENHLACRTMVVALDAGSSAPPAAHPRRGLTMKTLHLRSRADTNGMVRLDVPTDFPGSELDVLVTVQPAQSLGQSLPAEQWPAFVAATAGSISDPTFERNDQGQYEERDPLP